MTRCSSSTGTGSGRAGERGAVAVTLLLILVLGASSSPGGSVIGAGRPTGSILATYFETESRAEERACVRAESAAEGAGRTVAPGLASVAPRFRRSDGHAWPPPRAPTVAC